MQLLPISRPELLETVAAWLADPRNSRWLHFGPGVQHLSATALWVMVQRDGHLLRLFTADDEGRAAIGLVGLSKIDLPFKTATLWFVLGDKRYAGRGYTLRAAAMLLTQGFRDLGLNAIQSWAVEGDDGSLDILRGLNFRPIGTERQCHYIDGTAHDRLWFDLLAPEHKVIAYA